MKILHITPSYKPAFIYGGPIVSVAQLCEAEAALGQKVEVNCTRANGKEELPFTREIIQGVEVFYYSRLTGDHSHFSPILLLRTFFKATQFDIIHIHSWWNLVSIPLVFLLWCRRIQPILSPRGMLSPYTFSQSKAKSMFHRWIGRWLLSKTILHATSKQEIDEALKLLPTWRHFELPNIIQLPSINDYPSRKSSDQVFQVVFLSRVHPKKGLDFLLRVLPCLSIEWELSIIGSGDPQYLKKLQYMAKDLGSTERIKWIGWLDGKEKYTHLSSADLFILPSQNENFANVVLEALALGVPVMLSDQVGLSEYVENNNLGWVLPLQEELWIKTLSSAYADIGKRERIQQEAPAQVQRDFGAEQLAKRYLLAYQKILIDC